MFDYLSQLRSEGAYDSTGRFSLDTALTLEKLSRFQFQRRGDELLPIISALSRLDAQSLEVETGWAGMCLRARCRSLGMLDLKTLLDSPLDPAAAAVLQNLAVGLAAAARHYSSLTIVSFPETGAGARWQLRQGRLEVDPLEPVEQLAGMTLINLDSTLGQAWKQRLTFKAPRFPWNRCQYAPFTKKQPDPFSKLAVGLEGPLRHPPWSQGIPVLESPVTALLCLGVGNTGLVVVVNGVSYWVDAELPYRSMGVVWADHLRPDLSWTGVVQDETFEWLLGQVKEQLDRALVESIRVRGLEKHEEAWLVDLVARHRGDLTTEVQQLAVLKSCQGSPIAIGNALLEHKKYGWVPTAGKELPEDSMGRDLYRASPILQALEVSPLPVARQTANEPPVPLSLPPGPVRLPFHRHWRRLPFEANGLRGEFGIPTRPCSHEPYALIYRNQQLVSGKPVLPAGLDLIVEVGPEPKMELLAPMMVPLYRDLVQQVPRRPEWALTYVLAYLACAAVLVGRSNKKSGVVPYLALTERPVGVVQQLAEVMQIRYFCWTKMLPTRSGFASISEVVEHGAEVKLDRQQSEWLELFVGKEVWDR